MQAEKASTELRASEPQSQTFQPDFNSIESEKEQTLTIKPQNMIQKPIQIEDFPDERNLSEQELIDLECRKLREQVTIPYLLPLSSLVKWPKHAKKEEDVYTLVLDLDETLIHFEIDPEDPDGDGYYNIRPGALSFLGVLSNYYEIVIFTAAMPDVSLFYFLVF